jgi:hypothetical protein
MAKSVDIIVQAHDRMQGFDRAEKRLNRFGMGVKRLAMGVAGAFGLYLGGRAIASQMRASLEAFGEQEQAIAKLNQALQDLGAGGQLAGMQAYAAELQKLTTVGDEAALGMMQLGASIGRLSGEQLKKATQAAIGFSKAYGMELNAAMLLVAKAAQGNSEALSRYGIQLDKGLSDQEKFNEVLRRGAEAFRVAEAEAGTYSGRMAQLKNALGDVREEIGARLAPLVKSFAESILKHKTVIVAFAEGLMEGFRNIARVAVESFTMIEVVVGNWKAILKGAISFLAAAFLGWFEDIKHWFTVALPRYIEWFADNWVDVLHSAITAIGAGFKNFASNVVNIFKNLPDLISGNMKLADLWTPLLDGWQATFEALPEIADRQLTEMERKLLMNAVEAGTNIADEYGRKVQERLAALGLSGQFRPGAPGGLGGGAPPGEAGAAGKAAAYRPLKALESLLALRAPGQDPMARQVELSKRMVAALEKIEQHTATTEENTKPQTGGGWEPAPVY